MWAGQNSFSTNVCYTYLGFIHLNRTVCFFNVLWSDTRYFLGPIFLTFHSSREKNWAVFMTARIFKRRKKCVGILIHFWQDSIKVGFRLTLITGFHVWSNHGTHYNDYLSARIINPKHSRKFYHYFSLLRKLAKMIFTSWAIAPKL